MFSELERVLPVLEALTKELKVLNEHLFDLKKMIAPYLGWKIIDDKGGESQ